jgi:hypothetical protein
MAETMTFEIRGDLAKQARALIQEHRGVTFSEKWGWFTRTFTVSGSPPMLAVLSANIEKMLDDDCWDRVI